MNASDSNDLVAQWELLQHKETSSFKEQGTNGWGDVVFSKQADGWRVASELVTGSDGEIRGRGQL